MELKYVDKIQNKNVLTHFVEILEIQFAVTSTFVFFPELLFDAVQLLTSNFSNIRDGVCAAIHFDQFVMHESIWFADNRTSKRHFNTCPLGIKLL